MKQLLIITETLRNAGITTLYQTSLCLAVTHKPGITIVSLSKIMQASTESIRVLLRNLWNGRWVRFEKIRDESGGSKETRVYPTPKLKDLMRILDVSSNSQDRSSRSD